MDTEPGWLGKTEVVRVTFDPAVVSFVALVRLAMDRGCAAPVFVSNARQRQEAAGIEGAQVREAEGQLRPVEDVKYYLGRSELRHVPMTSAQAARINARVAGAKEWLSPRQLELLERVSAAPKRSWPNVVQDDVTVAFRKVREFEARAR